jgi:hypothetical protein
MAQPVEVGSLIVGVAALEDWSQYSITHRIKTINRSQVKEIKFSSGKQFFFGCGSRPFLYICIQEGGSEKWTWITGSIPFKGLWKAVKKAFLDNFL